MKNKILICTLSYLLLSCAGKPIDTSGIFTLAYYPDCDYKVLGTVKGENGLTSYEYIENRLSTTSAFVLRQPRGDRQKALYELKKNALELGADAIAITSVKNLQGSEIASKGGRFDVNKYVFQAQAIKLCDDLPLSAYNKPNSKPVRFDEEGNARLNSLSNTYGFNTESIQLDNVDESQPPELTGNSIHSQGQVFGLSFGQDLAEVLTVLGSPSARINSGEDELVLQYDRRHLFYFDDSEFVAYEYNDWFLPPHINNLILPSSQFEGLKWTLDNEIALGASKSSIEEHYGEQVSTNGTDSLLVEQGNIAIKFGFFKEESYYSDEKIYKLRKLTIGKKGFNSKTWQEIIANNSFSRTVNIAKNSLPIMPNFSKAQVVEELGKPKVIMKNAMGKFTWVYDNELFIDFFNEHVFHYSFIAGPISQEMDKCSSCIYLGQADNQMPEQYISQTNDFGFLLENEDVEYQVGFSEIDGIRQVDRIKIQTKL